MEILEANINNYHLLRNTLIRGNPIIIPTDTKFLNIQSDLKINLCLFLFQNPKIGRDTEQVSILTL